MSGVTSFSQGGAMPNQFNNLSEISQSNKGITSILRIIIEDYHEI